MSIWDVFEWLGAMPDVFENWRFYLCLLLSLGTVGGIYWLVPDQKIALVFSAIVAICGLAKSNGNCNCRRHQIAQCIRPTLTGMAKANS